MYDYLILNEKNIFVNTNDSKQVDKTKNANSFSFGTKSSDVETSFINALPYVHVNYNSLSIKSHLIGEYNYNNIAAAIAIGNYFKVEDHAIKTAIESYVPTNNRSQITNKGSNQIILDAYNANPTSMKAALLNFEKQSGYKLAILGDMFELGSEAKIEHQAIVDLAISLAIDKLVFVGENFFRTSLHSTSALKFKTFDSFKDQFNLSEIKHATLLIKGSRGMALERALELI